MTTSYTLSQNGIAARKNRKKISMTRSMLKVKDLPKMFWVEAVACIVFVLSSCLTRSALGRTLEEAWSGNKPNVSLLQVFGYVGIPIYQMIEGKC